MLGRDARHVFPASCGRFMRNSEVVPSSVNVFYCALQKILQLLPGTRYSYVPGAIQVRTEYLCPPPLFAAVRYVAVSLRGLLGLSVGGYTRGPR